MVMTACSVLSCHPAHSSLYTCFMMLWYDIYTCLSFWRSKFGTWEIKWYSQLYILLSWLNNFLSVFDSPTSSYIIQYLSHHTTSAAIPYTTVHPIPSLNHVIEIHENWWNQRSLWQYAWKSMQIKPLPLHLWKSMQIKPLPLHLFMSLLWLMWWTFCEIKWLESSF